jgi:hypothetical protein
MKSMAWAWTTDRECLMGSVAVNVEISAIAASRGAVRLLSGAEGVSGVAAAAAAELALASLGRAMAQCFALRFSLRGVYGMVFQ